MKRWRWMIALAVVVAVVSLTAATAAAGLIPGYPVLNVEPRHGYLIRCLPDPESDHQPYPVLFEQKPGNAYVVCLTR